MSHRLPRWTAKQLVRFLKSNGFIEKSQGGSHLHLYNPASGRKTTIPIHAGKIIGPGLFRAILVQAGINLEDVN